MAQVCSQVSSCIKSSVFSPSNNDAFRSIDKTRVSLFNKVNNVILPSKLTTRSKKLVTFASLKRFEENVPEESVTESKNTSETHIQDLLFASSALITPLLLAAEPANAAGGEFGILEGRTFALLHPIIMGGLFFYTLYAGYLGWQWRRVRTIASDISDLKKQIPASVEGAPVSPLQAEVDKLTEERKELVKGGFKDKHFNAGSILLGGGVLLAVGGSLNTWMRTGKLFPGPHLFAGAGITVLWALAAALVPAMQKGDDNARSAHIALNAVNVLLFIWQIPTGLDIVYKVFQFTSWP